jgi:hypothetical protein
MVFQGAPTGTGRRAQSLYCTIGLAKRRNKAIAPYKCADRFTTMT